ncbi:MAG: metal ABC transporter ATPase [Spirulinaceae cyanobacterium]
MIATVSEELERENLEVTEQKVGEFLQEHSEIEMIVPVVAGLFVTSQLRLRGARALLVNLLVASITRQIFAQMKGMSATPALAAETPVQTAADATETEYNIVHSVPGRVRVRMPRLGSDRAFAQRLETLLNAEDRVVKSRINRAASSVAIHYEAQGLSEWELGALLLSILEAASHEPTEAPA